MTRVKRLTFSLIFLNFLLWNYLMPIMEPADETGHYAHVLYLYTYRHLPNLNNPPRDGDIGFTTYPPLYYVTLLPIATLAQAPKETESLLQYNPQKQFLKHGVFALYFHTKEEVLGKWNRLMIAVHLMRFQTSLYGFLAVYLVFLSGKKIFGEKSLKPLIAASLVGFNPMFSHVVNSLVNINLNILLFSLFFYLCLIRIHKHCSLRFYLLLGIITGAAYLTKITGLALMSVTVIFILVQAKTYRLSAEKLLCGCFTHIVGFLAISGWYLLRNWHLYGNMLETSIALPYFGRPVAQQSIVGPINYWIGFFQTSFKTFFSGYGMLTIKLPDPVLFILLIASLIGIWGVCLKFGKFSRNQAFICVCGTVVLLTHVLVNMRLEAFHARDLFVGAVPFSLLFVEGSVTWLQGLRNRWIWKHRIMNMIMLTIIFGVTFFSWYQQLIVSSIHSILSDKPEKLIMLLGPMTMLFVLFFSIILFTNRLRYDKTKVFFNRLKSRWNQVYMTFVLTLFMGNLMILFALIVPNLYSL